MSCALGREEVAVIPEHIEDICVEYANRWRFLQVKSRDATRGAWTLSDLLGEDGALHSLFRAYVETSNLDATYELLLEQPISKNGLVGLLRSGENHHDERLVKPVQKALEATKKTAKAFLSRVALAPQLPGRREIDAVNVRLLGTEMSGQTMRAIETAYAAALQCIEAGMAVEAPAQKWPAYVRDVSTPEIRFAAKRLTKGTCAELSRALSGVNGRLLRRTLDVSMPRPTALEAKLLSAGLPDSVVKDAIRLRAQAAYIEAEHLASAPDAQSAHSRLEDVQERLRMRALAAQHAHAGTPLGPALWDRLMTILFEHAEALDPNGVFSRDPMLLMGEICELSDQCHIDWKE